jgi:hypothetical protein
MLTDLTSTTFTPAEQAVAFAGLSCSATSTAASIQALAATAAAAGMLHFVTSDNSLYDLGPLRRLSS